MTQEMLKRYSHNVACCSAMILSGHTRACSAVAGQFLFYFSLSFFHNCDHDCTRLSSDSAAYKWRIHPIRWTEQQLSTEQTDNSGHLGVCESIWVHVSWGRESTPLGCSLYYDDVLQSNSTSPALLSIKPRMRAETGKENVYQWACLLLCTLL